MMLVDRKRWIIIWGMLALLVFAPPALLLFGRFERESARDRENEAAFDQPAQIVQTPAQGHYVPPGDKPGEIRKFGEGTLIRALVVSPNGRELVAGSSDSTLRTWSLDGQSSTSYGGAYSEISAIAYTRDGLRAVAGGNGLPMIWDFRNGQVSYFNTGSHGPISRVAIAPNGATAATGSSQRYIRIWNLQNLTEVGLIGQHDGGVIAIAYSADGRRVHSASDVGEFGAWELKTGHNLTSRRHSLPWKSAAFSPDGKLLVAGGLDGIVRLYDVENHGNIVRHMRAHQHFIDGVAFSPDGSRFVTVGGVELALWETSSGKKISTLRLSKQGSVNGAVAVLPTNRHVVFGGNGVSLVLMPDEPSAATSRPTDAK